MFLNQHPQFNALSSSYTPSSISGYSQHPNNILSKPNPHTSVAVSAETHINNPSTKPPSRLIRNPDGTYLLNGKVLTEEQFQRLKILMLKAKEAKEEKEKERL